MPENANLAYMYKGNDFFICKHKTKIVGLATVRIDAYSLYTDDPLDTYTTTRYKLQDGNQIFDKNNNNIVKYNSGNSDPRIESLCKDKNYKNVGKVILEYIEKYYRKKGATKIYLVPGSNKHYNVLINAHKHKNEDAIKKYDIMYKQDNQHLIKYYTKNGYNILEKHYDYTLIQDNNIFFCNVMYKNI